MFVSFCIRGRSLPISDFFRGLLYFYEIWLTHLNPTSILRILIFVHLCEAYLGITPYFDLFHYIFVLVHLPQDASAPMRPVGCADIQIRNSKKKPVSGLHST
uniref:Transposase (putative) gypsy type domain-containing protein n=1 Tax=Arundo donax TaxID=35708 RepID=A0A0A9GV42_ARUDO